MNESNDSPTMRLHLWIETAEGLCFGLGRAMLLAKIDEHGSLKRAAEDLNMSYRAAWGKIKKSEEILKVKLVAQKGGKNEGYQLTDSGRALMESYFVWFQEVEREALKRAKELFPWNVKCHDRSPVEDRVLPAK